MYLLAGNWEAGSFFFSILCLLNSFSILREDPSLLVHEGLTLQNQIRAGVTAVSGGWVLLLVVTKRLSFSSLFARSGFWLSVLILTFIASTFWSEWKEYTLYRSIELGIYWALALHLFSNANWHQNLTRYLRFAVAVYIFGKLFSLGLSPNSFLGGLRTNFGSVIAACLLTDVAFRFLYLRKRGSALSWEFVYGFVALVLFGSIATILISTAGFATLFFYRWSLRARVILLGVALIISAASIFVSAASLHDLSRIEGVVGNMEVVSALTGKNAENLLTISGRIPLWEALWWETKDSVWGGGFASAERLACIRLTGFGWMPPNAHNGYLSSWINAGWLGFILVLAAFLAIWQFSRYSVDSKPFDSSHASYHHWEQLDGSRFWQCLHPGVGSYLLLGCSGMDGGERGIVRIGVLDCFPLAEVRTFRRPKLRDILRGLPTPRRVPTCRERRNNPRQPVPLNVLQLFGLDSNVFHVAKSFDRSLPFVLVLFLTREAGDSARS